MNKDIQIKPAKYSELEHNWSSETRAAFREHLLNVLDELEELTPVFQCSLRAMHWLTSFPEFHLSGAGWGVGFFSIASCRIAMKLDFDLATMHIKCGEHFILID